MILNNPKLKSKLLGDSLLRDIPSPKQHIYNPVRRVIEPIREWGQIALLLLKLFKLSKKVKILTLERENFLRERRDLVIQKRDLQAEKVDNVFAESCGADNADRVFGKVGGAHGASSSSLANSVQRKTLAI